MISISIVSHGQFDLVKVLLDDLEKFCKNTVEVLLTVNIPEVLPENFSHYAFPVKLIINPLPKGFGANHNAAFRQATQPFFCVLNPDIRLVENPFNKLINNLSNEMIGVTAPAIMDTHNRLQDSARKFMTITELLRRIFYPNQPKDFPTHPDWVAGTFMLFRKEVYAGINGFDEAYFMYGEDMDLCARLRQKNYEIYYNNTVKIIHIAQRQSHKNIRYLIWHIQSLLRFFCRYYFY